MVKVKIKVRHITENMVWGRASSKLQLTSKKISINQDKQKLRRLNLLTFNRTNQILGMNYR